MCKSYKLWKKSIKWQKCGPDGHVAHPLCKFNHTGRKFWHMKTKGGISVIPPRSSLSQCWKRLRAGPMAKCHAESSPAAPGACGIAAWRLASGPLACESGFTWCRHMDPLACCFLSSSFFGSPAWQNVKLRRVFFCAACAGNAAWPSLIGLVHVLRARGHLRLALGPCRMKSLQQVKLGLSEVCGGCF